MLTAPIDAVTETGPDLVGTTSSRMPARNRSAATLVSSTVQFLKISPNLLPENRPEHVAAAQPGADAFSDFGDHGVRDVEAEGVVDARQMIDADQHEGAGRPEARGFLDRFRQRGDQMRAVEFAGQRIVPRQPHELFVAGVALIVDADDALRARRLAVGPGKPATGFLDPDHGRGGRWPARRIRSGRRRPRRRAPAADWSSASDPDRARGLDQLGELRAAGQRFRRDIGEDRAGIVAPGDGVGCQVPDESRLPERGKDAGGLRDSGASGRLDFGTPPGDSHT